MSWNDHRFGPGTRAGPLLPYAVAVVTVLAGAALRLALDPVAGDFYAFTVFYALVPAVAWQCGCRAALLAVALSVALVNYGLLQPRGGLSLNLHALFGSITFVAIGSGLALLGDRLRRSRDQLRRKKTELEREVAERKTAEAEVERLNALLRQRIEELQAVIEASPIGIAVANDPACENIWTNRVVADLLGVPENVNISKTGPDAARLPYRVLRNGVELPAAELPMQYCGRHGANVRDAEVEIVRADGSRRVLLVNAAPLHDAAGKVRGCVGVYQDITERKAAEAEREQVNRHKDEFLATLAHELRNPLAPLRNVAALIQQQEHKDRRWQWIGEVIERQVGHMAHLVDDLLDLARVTRGLITLHPEDVELRALVWRAVELVRPLLDERRQRLRVELPLAPVPLRADPVRMTQVIANILNNAAKFTPEGGTILVSAAPDGGSVQLKIRDSGRGISAELLPRIFDVFVQGERTAARTEGGLGIGLPLVKRLVELHDGTVTASSAGAGQGTEIVVTLPQGAATAPVSALPAGAAAESSSILVVDDSVDVADSLAMLLRGRGHEVRVAYSAAAAIAAVRDFEPDVALLDIGLPDMDGYALAARLREEPRLRRMQLVALSGYGGERDRSRSRAAGFTRHLAKPYSLEQIEAVLAGVETDDVARLPGADPRAPRPDLAVD